MFHRTFVAFVAAAALGWVPVPTNAFAAGHSGSRGAVGHATGGRVIAGHARGGNIGGRYAGDRGGWAYGSYGGYGGYGGYDGCPGYGYGYGNGYGCPGYGVAPLIGGVIGGVLGGRHR